MYKVRVPKLFRHLTMCLFQNDNNHDSSRAEIEGVKTLLKEAEAENRLLRWLLTATVGFMVYVVYRFS